ncbi:hypothetical protein [Hydrogenimonas sp. SS33]|uniref:hypothetical protein n=1 Tax=Hydrogenimonas leucolamina TaxID=2954236 RepID=UPI00336BB69C
MKRVFLFCSATILVLLSGCATRYPMGLDEKTWQTLPPAERVRLREKQAEIDAKLQAQEERHRHEERMRQLQIEKEREARITTLYKRAGYGNIVRVNIEGGCYREYKKCERYRPVSVILALGETKRVPLVMRYGQKTLWIRYDKQGVTIDDDSNLNDFDAAVLLPRRWERGSGYRISLKEPYRKGGTTLTNAEVFVRFFPIRNDCPPYRHR